MFNNNAYLYQYYKYGLEKERFLECFAVMENVVLNYSKIWFLGVWGIFGYFYGIFKQFWGILRQFKEFWDIFHIVDRTVNIKNILTVWKYENIPKINIYTKKLELSPW